MTLYTRQVDYKPQFESIIDHLGNGITAFSGYLQNLKATFNEQQDDINYIKYKLLPLLETAKQKFDFMKDSADTLLQQLNQDFERCVADVCSKNQQLKTIVMKVTELQAYLDRSKEEIRDAEIQCDRKRSELSNAESTLSIAIDKLSKAREEQEKTVIVGTATAVGSAFLALVFPPAFVGVAGGLATTTIGLTVFEDAKKACDNHVDTARSQVLSSRHALEKAKEKKRNTEQEISRSHEKKLKAEKEREKAIEENKTIKAYQSRCIAINEGIKLFYREICNLNGKVKILHMETDGGYSLTMLKEPTLIVCASLSSLLRCPALCDSCSQLKIQKMAKKLRAIESGWCLSIASEDTFYNVCITFVVVVLSIFVFYLFG